MKWSTVLVTGSIGTRATGVQLTPPLVERNANSSVMKSFCAGMITSPSGCTRGWPPMPLALSAVGTGVLHVRPPSVE